jgi:hypothetical protein
MILEEQAPRPWWNTNYGWANDDLEKLKIFAEVNADLNRSAAALAARQQHCAGSVVTSDRRAPQSARGC